ncbi:hypothetical protein BCR39DRAFT_469578 [Naematelia encephala]|uniref:Subtelomeric hrmA-associated cluster protein AFUB-079030/YDR124W-like helical bundle domain-containing protein n=1 Tax=Naematelia encephala TaxID=71784 RepID=A0A1Y2AXA3_9TREE|nr:hypothetical protein BCR39DRAFT_469578 [Naematelia encephala]
MPRIPVRTTPYHTLPRCTRHYKSKRDLILRALGKASFINGSQFVIAWISPKGEVDVYASELLQASVSSKEGGVLARAELEGEARRVRGEMSRRWDEIRRLEESGEAPVLEDEDATFEGGEEDDAMGAEGEESMDPDRTMVEDGSSDIADHMVHGLLKRPSPGAMMSMFPRAATPQTTPLHTITLPPAALDTYYAARFAALQQATCKLVVKAWIKVIEPKKQMKFPYNRGEELRPTWWPEGVRHREPDHLSKTERLTLLASIVRSPLISVSRLELSTAEAAAFISRPRLAILREVYLVAKEEEKRRASGDVTSDVVVHMPNLPVSPSAVSPDAPEKRSHDKENVFSAGGPMSTTSVYEQHSAKRVKHVHAPAHLHAHAQQQHAHRLAPLTISAYDNYAHPFTFAPQAHLSAPASAHLSPYPSDGGMPFSPNPDGNPHPNHLAPILNPAHAHTPTIDPHSPAFPHASTMQNPNNGNNYFPRGQGYLQQQQIEYLAQHQQGYDYGSPYLADNWEGGYTQTS